MSIPERIVSFLNQHSGQSFCDACIQRACELKSSRQVARVTAVLALSPDYDRIKRECCRCGSLNKLATQAV